LSSAFEPQPDGLLALSPGFETLDYRPIHIIPVPDLKKVRIEKAMELLKDPELKVYEISGMVGYNNTKHFTTTFREYTGISPSEYRERINV
jgi:two-component system response regulator YesN